MKIPDCKTVVVAYTVAQAVAFGIEPQPRPITVFPTVSSGGELFTNKEHDHREDNSGRVTIEKPATSNATQITGTGSVTPSLGMSGTGTVSA